MCFWYIQAWQPIQVDPQNKIKAEKINNSYQTYSITVTVNLQYSILNHKVTLSITQCVLRDHSVLDSDWKYQALSALIARRQAGTAVRRGKSVLMMCGAARYPLIYTFSQESLSWNISGSWPSFFRDHQKLELWASQFQTNSSISETYVTACEAIRRGESGLKLSDTSHH